MLRGTCSKCGAQNQRFHDIDRKYKHRALKCFTCGHITHYVSRNGTIYDPPAWEDDLNHDDNHLFWVGNYGGSDRARAKNAAPGWQGLLE